MTSSKVSLRWRGDGLVFVGGAPGGPEIVVDSDGNHGPSPTQTLLLALAGCMGVDVRLILEKGKVHVESFDVDVEGDRVDGTPRRFHTVRLTYRVKGLEPQDRPKLERAVELSKQKYCSVLHTLRPDLFLDVRIECV